MKRRGCGMLLAVVLGVCLVGCLGVLGLGVAVGPSLGKLPPAEAPVKAPKQTAEERQKAGVAEFLEIVALKDHAERDKRLKAWEVKYPDLVENMRRNATAAADK